MQLFRYWCYTGKLCSKERVISRNKGIKRLTAFLLFETIDSFCGVCRARSACTYVQSDLALHSPLIYHDPFYQRNIAQCYSTKCYGRSLLPYCLAFPYRISTLQQGKVEIFLRVKELVFSASINMELLLTGWIAPPPTSPGGPSWVNVKVFDS